MRSRSTLWAIYAHNVDRERFGVCDIDVLRPPSEPSLNARR